VTYSWVRQRQRKRVPYENPEGRRVNALAALVTAGADPALYWVAKPGSLQSDHLVAFLTDLPAVAVPTVIVLDNGAIHRSKATRAAVPTLWARGVYLYYLPPYSPDLNAIEPVFRTIKHYRMPERRYATLPALIDAVHAAFTTFEEDLIAKSVLHPRRSA
jgi:putative transposase